MLLLVARAETRQERGRGGQHCRTSLLAPRLSKSKSKFRLRDVDIKIRTLISGVVRSYLHQRFSCQLQREEPPISPRPALCFLLPQLVTPSRCDINCESHHTRQDRTRYMYPFQHRKDPLTCQALQHYVVRAQTDLRNMGLSRTTLMTAAKRHTTRRFWPTQKNNFGPKH